MPLTSASASTGADEGRVAIPGRSSRNSAVELRMKGRWRGNSRIATASVGGDSTIASWMNGRATLASAMKVVSRFTNSEACCSDDGGDLGGCVAKLLEEAVDARAGRGQVGRHRLEVPEQRPERLDRRVERGAAAGKAVAEALQRVLGAAARRCRRRC